MYAYVLEFTCTWATRYVLTFLHSAHNINFGSKEKKILTYCAAVMFQLTLIVLS